MELGTKVRFDRRSVLWRAHLAGGKRRWDRVRFVSGPVLAEGVVVGERILANGTVEYGGWDGSTEFYPTGHFKAYLIAFDMRRKPVYVRPEDVEEIDG